MRIIRYLGASFLAVGLGTTAFGTVVSSTSDATVLANNILGSGVTLVGTPTYTGASGAAGTFSGGTLGFSDGIVLTTGSASIAGRSVNTQTDAGVANNTPGDSALSSFSGFTTHDAATLSFNFKISDTAAGNLYFNYIFASEEYNEYVNSAFNDVFAFFLDGHNIALFSDGTPVTINNVNNFQHSGSYIPNRFGDTTPFQTGTPGTHPTEYDGYTVALTAKAEGIAAGEHTITLAIADSSDYILDSAVFIQAGTFSTIETPVPEPTTIIAGALLLLPFGFSILRKCRKA